MCGSRNSLCCRSRGDCGVRLSCQKCAKGLVAFIDTLAAAVAAVGISNNRSTEFLAVGSYVKGRKKI